MKLFIFHFSLFLSVISIVLVLIIAIIHRLVATLLYLLYVSRSLYVNQMFSSILYNTIIYNVTSNMVRQPDISAHKRVP